VQKYTEDLFQHPYSDMFLSSFKDVNDLGDYPACEQLGTYYLTTLNLT